MRKVQSDSHTKLFQFVANVQELSQIYETALQIYRQPPSRTVDQGRLTEQEIQRQRKGQEQSHA